ncbi:MAG: GyrI-like domain-containing protein [Fibrobacteria bacterium]
MKKQFWIAVLMSLAPAAALAGSGPTEYEPGIPRIIMLPPQRVLTLTAQGDPNVVAGAAFKKLFSTFRAHADKAEKRHPGSAMARWPIAQMDGAKVAWRGEYAFPISEKFPAVPKGEIRDTVWERGAVAEILHVGSYDGEAADIMTLKEFLVRNGYAAQGYHEEVYVKGPGMIFKGDHRKYRTLIRYQVVRVGEAPSPIAKQGAELGTGRTEIQRQP